jgi:hypothetical protein
MMTKRQALISALANIVNPIYFGRNYDTYVMYCKTVISMLDDFKTSCHICDDVIRMAQAEIETIIACVKYQNKAIDSCWNKLKVLNECVAISTDTTATWNEYEKAYKTAYEIF